MHAGVNVTCPHTGHQSPGRGRESPRGTPFPVPRFPRGVIVVPGSTSLCHTHGRRQPTTTETGVPPNLLINRYIGPHFNGQEPQAPAAAEQEAEPIADAVVEAEPEAPAERGEDPEDQEDAKISKKRTRDEFEAQNQGAEAAQEVIQSQQSNTKRLKVEENQISSPAEQVAEQNPPQQNQAEEEPAE